ncbi:procathepsin L-like [Phymastichus coffea]|uniref:procathepsin L-like n=1 Tax=Phymastichus coffea TaxID=108790 RepID=UPI00273C75CA|nr:procathepsin L-like [Phymastichus coffea]
MKISIIFVLTVIYVAHSFSVYDTILEEWQLFKTMYRKNYANFEEKVRFNIYMENRKKIAEHNKKFEGGEVTFSMAINRFGDMTSYEVSRKMNGFNKTARTKQVEEYVEPSELAEGATFIEPANVELPNQIDWRKQGAVSPIKDQGECGSCWAFSSTGALEGQHFRRNGTLISLSEQNLVDCSGRYGNNGCDGGLMQFAFAYVKANRGIDTEKSYPYEGEDDACRYNPRNRGADDVGYVSIPRAREDKLQAAVATVGPISVAIDADSDDFIFYESGIFYSNECSSVMLDHAVLAVGYGTDNKTGKDYWLVKNSWGEDWGEKGYVRMSRNRHNNCGIATSAIYPLVK